MHREALSKLVRFGEEPERILYIDESPRPRQPWFEILRALGWRLLSEPLETAAHPYGDTIESWPRLIRTVEEDTDGLSLPEGVTSPLEVLSADLRDRLWLQTCCLPLVGLGHEPGITLARKEERWRIDAFIEYLHEYSDALEGVGLTLERLRRVVALPPEDQARFERLLSERLGQEGPGDSILLRLD